MLIQSGQGLNGESQETVDYAGKTHELQTIIEKQVILTFLGDRLCIIPIFIILDL